MAALASSGTDADWRRRRVIRTGPARSANRDGRLPPAPVAHASLQLPLRYKRQDANIEFENGGAAASGAMDTGGGAEQKRVGREEVAGKSSEWWRICRSPDSVFRVVNLPPPPQHDDGLIAG